MATREELERTVRVALDSLGGDADTVLREPGATVTPRWRAREQPRERVVDLLGELPVTDAERLQVRGTLGEGGMGLVHIGRQTALGREVAVKTLKREHRAEGWALKLLREAWLTGGLEHPNVVPVYDIGRDADGAPLVVLKKIDGDDWRSLMRDPDAVRARFGADDLLEWNLGVLTQVCHALRFAHSRGIVHRDIKPENVMVGPFGEVYVLDWGIAVSLRDDGTGRLPLAGDARGLAGTPAFMAPEMFGGPGDTITERTDIYLLGAVLYLIATGRVPHRGATWFELVTSVCRAEPEVPADVPEELAAIIRRAMRADAAERFATVDELRLALQRFLRHRDAVRLAARAAEAAAAMARLCEEGGDEPAGTTARREAIYRHFAECRFGFRQALEEFPDYAPARADLERATVRVIEYELSRGHPHAARALLGELGAAPPALAERVAQAERVRAEEERALRRLQADADPRTGRRLRAVVAVVLAAACVAAPAYAWVRHFVLHHPVNPRFGLVASLGLLALMCALAVWARRALTRTRINRALGAGAFLGVAAPVLSHIAAIIQGGDIWAPLHEAHLAWAVVTAVLAVAVDVRLAASAVAYALGYVGIALVGRRHVLLSVTATNVVLLANVALLWARPHRERERDGGRETP